MGPGGMGGRGMRGDMSGEGFGATDSTVSGGFGESKGRGPRAMDGKMTEGTDGEFPGEPPEGFDGEMPEGADGTMPDMNGGEGFTVPSSTGEDYAVYIYGGNITVNCDGDGIDSNGNIYVYGGTTLVYASEDGGNGAIDYGDINSSLIVTGGTLLAAGNAQMAQWPGASSPQKSIAVTLSSNLGAGDDVLGQVLVVAVHGDDAVDLRPMLQAPGKGGLHGPAFALVDLVGQHGDLRVLRRLPEGGEMVVVAAVVDQDDVREALGQQPLHHLHQLFIRIQGGDDDGNVHKCSAFFQIRGTHSC